MSLQIIIDPREIPNDGRNLELLDILRNPIQGALRSHDFCLEFSSGKSDQRVSLNPRAKQLKMGTPILCTIFEEAGAPILTRIRGFFRAKK
jgi:hypothetical protein